MDENRQFIGHLKMTWSIQWNLHFSSKKGILTAFLFEFYGEEDEQSENTSTNERF